MYETVKAFKLPWNTVSHLIGLEVSKILGRNIVCKANMDDHDYWAAQFVDERIPLSELYKLMETVNADEKARNESLPESTRTQSSAKEVGLGVAELFFTSRLFAGHLEDLAAAQTRRYHYNRRVRVNIYWNAKDSFFAATDNMQCL